MVCGVARLDRPRRVLEHVDAGGAAVRVLHQPAEAQPSRQARSIAWSGREREGRDAEPVDVAALDPGRREARANASASSDSVVVSQDPGWRV